MLTDLNGTLCASQEFPEASVSLISFSSSSSEPSFKPLPVVKLLESPEAPPSSDSVHILLESPEAPPSSASVHIQLTETEMAMNYLKSLRSLPITEVTGGLGGCRTFAVGGKSKKGKGGGASDATKQPILSKEVKSTTVIGANILKEGEDPKILPDSEYPDSLWTLLDKKPALSGLRRKNIEDLTYEELKRFVKLDNRGRIKENNSIKAKN